MSSEMFYPSGDDVDRMIELAIQCGIDSRGTSWPLELCRVRAKLRALLARTEAGADGAFVAWAAVSPRGTILALYGDKAQAERDVRRFGDIPDAVIRPLVWGDAHPQDASGDALKRVEAVLAEFEGMTGFGYRYMAANIRAAIKGPAAMQAKEAK